MAKRIKRLGKGVESLKKQIEEHFSKIENDIKEKRFERGRYHVKEIDKGFLKVLELKLEILGVDDDSIEIYRERLNKLKKTLDAVNYFFFFFFPILLLK